MNSACGKMFLLCRPCDRGNRYCSGACSASIRRESLKAARRRHRQSTEGRADHRDRQRDYRRRRAGVVDHGPKNLPRLTDVVLPQLRGEEDHVTTLRIAVCPKRSRTKALVAQGERARLKPTLSQPSARSRPLPTSSATIVLGDREEEPRCASCGRIGRYVRHETLARSRRRYQAEAPVSSRRRARPPPST